MGAPHKTKMIGCFHIGNLMTSIHKVPPVASSCRVILYIGIHCTIGILVPSMSRDNMDFISTWEQHMHTEQGSFVGRDWLSQ
jgi:splicing factor 3B subunit 3